MDLHYIVDKLNSPPFEYSLSLLTLSEKSSQELLQLVSDVFSQISPKQKKIDISKEDADATADRLLRFLKIVKYKPPSSLDPATFRSLLGSGDRDVIYGILKWVVPQPEELQKKAFVGFYLTFPDMPEELNYDGDIMELKEEIKALQQQFIEVHKANEGVKAAVKDSTDMKKRIKGLEDEKERLTDKVAKAKAQVDKIQDKASYMDVCSSLRKQQDEEVNLSIQMQDQNKKLEKADDQLRKVNARLRELQASNQEGSATKIFDRLNEEVTSLRSQVNERGPKELEKRQKKVAALQEALSNDPSKAVNSEFDLQKLQGQANSLHSQIAEIQERRVQADKARQGDKAFLQLRQAQQMATMVARKKDELSSKLERLQEKEKILKAQLDKLMDGNSGVGIVSDEEWRQKYESMKSALPQYKKMKKELGDIEAEVFVLAYTEELLQAQEEALNTSIKKTAKKHGVAGFTDVANDLEKVSEQKSLIDEVKGMTLAEISKTVEEINASINDRKVRLAPHIKKLRLVRQQFADLEAEHNSLKQQYDASMSQYDNRVSSIESEVGALKAELMENESKYHLLHCQLNIVDHNVKRVSNGPAAERLKEKYQAKVTQSEEQGKVLKEKQKDIKDSHTTGLSQIDMMTDLVKLLQLKVDLHKREMGIAVGSSSVLSAGPIGRGEKKSGGGGSNVFVL
ncbi:hypothetical protein CEUSTIGMA_g5895.t1 [Chlamydomonas eustigma]|uniref:IFT81 calponin homology domain-containing protein n=1 Tax=Chlamydomonas eustigma TaxID=1157962 RepID=A0A250X5V0_9CHLO|nr:hypothetical protein CEUSTIGMA_g5895.t1 [Chlamydomonas eustigma]|eukprot:GAX78455.1 hypothetical protein CEUSTIGMA_g5895.t1 [Chlamydomonas eustigma]